MCSSPVQVKPDYKIGICCLSTKHAVLRSKSKDWLAGNQDNVSAETLIDKATNIHISSFVKLCCLIKYKREVTHVFRAHETVKRKAFLSKTEI